MFIVPMHIRLPQRHYGLKWLRSPWGDRVIGFCLGRHLCEVHFMRGLPPSACICERTEQPAPLRTETLWSDGKERP